ncbi:MAG: type IV pilus biogenesis/stability protein PilW [Burkholderiaceae bacterium]
MRTLFASMAVTWLVLLGGCATTGQDDNMTRKDGKSVSVIPEAEIDTEERRRARIRLELAAGHYQSRNYNTALAELRTALSIDPSYASAYGMLGLIYMDLDDRERADASFRRAMDLSPGNPDINNNYGWFLCQTGREREAVPLFERAAADPLYPVPAKPLHNAGICLRKVGDDEAAESYLQRAFKADPRNPVAMFNLGEIYLERKDFERAQFYSQRLVKTFEPAAQTLWLALKVENARGNRDGVLSLGSQLRSKFPAARETELLRLGNSMIETSTVEAPVAGAPGRCAPSAHPLNWRRPARISA